MTLPPEDDRLVQFLRQHRAAPPPAEADLERRIMAAVEAESSSTRRAGRPRYHRWTIPALAASLLLTWVALRPTAPPETEVADLDTFLAETWYGATYGDDTVRLALDTTDPDWVFSVYATPY
jgi:hypothetical protein